MKSIHTKVMSVMQNEKNYEAFLEFLATEFHNEGHILVGKACKRPNFKNGVMEFSEVSARWDLYSRKSKDKYFHSDRDPIFYRWHSLIENMGQQYRDNKLPSYSKEDFKLSDGIRRVLS